jgi:hypothetical protein
MGRTLHGDHVAVEDGGGAGKGEGGGFHWVRVERAPDVDDAVAACEERGGFGGGGGVSADALLGRGGGLVDVDAGDGFTRGVRVAAADCVWVGCVSWGVVWG